MAMEIIIQAEIANNNEIIENEDYSAIDDELNECREKDSGHWSFDCIVNGEENMTASPDDSNLSEEGESSTDNNNNDIPIPPPLPPLKGYACKDDSSELQIIPIPWTPGSLDNNNIPIPPPLPPLKGYAAVPAGNNATIQLTPTSLSSNFVDGISLVESLPTPIITEEDDESKCCIVCFDPNRVTEYDDFDYTVYMEVHQVINSHLNLPCCKRFICKSCIDGIISTTVGEGRVQISCPHPECDEPFTKEYILSNISSTEVKQKYQQFLVDVENDGKRKTCPKCCHITEHQLPTRIRQQEKDLKISCEVCQLEWCFRCHAPWHKDVSCRQFQKGSKEFQKWTKSKQRGVPNCQQCPTCRVYIQRSTGCHQMECNRCHTGFCYDCGNRFLELGIIDHESTLNVWGCPDNYHKDEPFVRNTVRWGYLTAKLSYLIAYPPLLVGACGLLAIGAVIVLPVYGGFKLYSYSKFKKANNRRRGRR